MREAKMNNPVELLITNVFNLFVNCNDGIGDGKLPKEATSVVRLHTDRLKKTGDLSVSGEDGWSRLLRQCDASGLSDLARQLFENSENEAEREAACRLLVNATAQCVFPLTHFKISNGHGVGYLLRTKAINEIMQLVINNEEHYGMLEKRASQRVHLLALQQDERNDKLTYYRAALIHKVLHKLLQHSSWTIEKNDENDENLLKVQVTSVAQEIVKNHNNNNCSFIKCGIVTEPTTRKLAALTTEEYHALRSNDIYLMARHKYGIRTKCDELFKALITRLGEAAATVDLLEVKHTSPVNIIRNGTGSTKGAAFILYNSARLETLLRTFEQHVTAKTYPPLPALQEIDLTLLTEEEEWQLIYVHIFAFPQLIETCLDRLRQGLVSTHLIVRFLNKFISLFSVYYRRVRIFTEGRNHLLPVLFARIYLLKAVRIVLNKTLALLDISPIKFM